jgi:hypothetical protein
MRVRIVHYQPMEGKGLIASEGRQYAFSIAQWHSETAPALNGAVEFEIHHNRPVSIRRLSKIALAWGSLHRFFRLPSDRS